MQTDYKNDFYRKKYINAGTYLVGILLFLLPFVEIKCNNTSFAENSGVGLALGTDYKILEQVKLDKSENSTSATIKSSRNNGKMYVVALIALLLGIAGLCISLAVKRPGPVNMIVGSLAAIFLIILMFQLKADVNDQVRSNQTDNIFNNAVIVSVNFTAWYYLSIICFLLAAFFSFKQSSSMGNRDFPPKNAPQVRIDNPGDQSEFPTYPDSSEMER